MVSRWGTPSAVRLWVKNVPPWDPLSTSVQGPEALMELEWGHSWGDSQSSPALEEPRDLGRAELSVTLPQLV